MLKASIVVHYLDGVAGANKDTFYVELGKALPAGVEL